MTRRDILIGLAIVLIAAAWIGRFHIVQMEGHTIARLDRWTGTVRMCAPTGCKDLAPIG